jgi:antitoxin PrlF
MPQSTSARATARLTTKSQLVLPKAIRDSLGVVPGDTLAFRSTPQGIIVEKVNADDPFASFEEWASEADEQAYRDL